MRTPSPLVLMTIVPLAALLGAGCNGKDDAGDDTGPTTETTDSGTTDDGTTDNGTTDDTGTAPVGDYSLTITAPANNAAIDSAVTLTYTVSGLTLDPDAMGNAHVEGTGHVHIYVDGVYLAATGATSYDITDLSVGAHTLGAVLAQNDHIEYTDTLQTITVNVGEEGTPLVVITSPDFGSDTVGSSVELGLLFTNFEVVDDAGGSAADGEGHYHIYVDGSYYGFDTNPVSTVVTNLSEGEHDLRVVLANNDHTELSPQIDDTIQINVPAGSPSITITDPSPSDVTDSASLPVSVALDNFTLSDNVGGPNRPGEGHYHLLLNGEYADLSTDLDTYLLHTPGGEHQLMVSLVNNDHSEIGVVDWINIEVAADRPDVTITSPPSGEIVTSDFTIAVSAENFTFDPGAIGSASVEDEGHYHVFVDGVYVAASANSTTTIYGLSSGDHRISVYLYNNDHSEIAPAVFDEIVVTVN